MSSLSIKNRGNYPWIVYLAILPLAALFAFTHFVATWKIVFSGGYFLNVNEQTIKNVALIQWMHSNVWFPASCLFLALAGVLYLHVRKASWWTPWPYSLFLAAPWCMYFSICAYIMGKFVGYPLR